MEEKYVLQVGDMVRLRVASDSNGPCMTVSHRDGNNIGVMWFTQHGVIMRDEVPVECLRLEVIPKEMVKNSPWECQ